MTEVWAHRGASGYAPENTMPAFRLALAQQADGVEFDVQLSADGAMVVIHDETLDRTTNGTGPVVARTLAELRSFDASGDHDGFDGVQIPVLDEVLELLAPATVTINIELKNTDEPYPGLEEKVVGAIREHSVAQRVVLSTFNHYSLRKLASLDPGCELAALYTDPLFRPWRYAADLGVTAIHPPYACVFGKGFTRKARQAGIAVRPWVVNSQRRLQRMLDYGVDAVFTDVPDVARALRAERGRAVGTPPLS